jgi:TetR/AcrR family transcriptional regulator, transcriptional repressor for nem operon
MRELTASMGISGPSLYNAFGGKRAVFTPLALLRSVPARAHQAARGERGPRKTQSVSIEEIIQSSLCDPERRGCLLINLALEIAPHDRELGAVIGGCLAKIAFFRRSIKAAQKQRSAGAA